ncbi:MAG: hypothetical protein COB51_08585 [Moraxellaceae bacterium]|nr:MAG: hypothetical protein COB51_08585 [Moraxellaceae bacterium]
MNRILSLVVYLNQNGLAEYGAYLVLYRNKYDSEGIEGIKVTPGFGAVVAFLSEDFPYEVEIA